MSATIATPFGYRIDGRSRRALPRTVACSTAPRLAQGLGNAVAKDHDRPDAGTEEWTRRD